MTTSELIELLKKYEHGGASGRPREVMFCVGEQIYSTDIKDISTGDGLITELFLDIDAQSEIVRCKDCEYCHIKDDYEAWCHGGLPASLTRALYDFCSRGKRKNDTANDIV